MEEPYRERTKTLARHWVEYGFGAPKITAVIYIAKLLFFYVLGGVLVATLTSDLNPLHPASWWDEPIIYQKAILWTVLLECLGLAGSWGPLAGHFKPMTGGFRYYARVDTISLPPWPDRVPFTRATSAPRSTSASTLALLGGARRRARSARRPGRRRDEGDRRQQGPRPDGRDRPDHRAAGSARPTRQWSRSSPRAASSTFPR